MLVSLSLYVERKSKCLRKNISRKKNFLHGKIKLTWNGTGRDGMSQIGTFTIHIEDFNLLLVHIIDRAMRKKHSLQLPKKQKITCGSVIVHSHARAGLHMQHTGIEASERWSAELAPDNNIGSGYVAWEPTSHCCSLVRLIRSWIHTPFCFPCLFLRFLTYLYKTYAAL